MILYDGSGRRIRRQIGFVYGWSRVGFDRDATGDDAIDTDAIATEELDGDDGEIYNCATKNGSRSSSDKCGNATRAGGAGVVLASGAHIRGHKKR